ncbi:MAG: BamA/TamA family outer membrane protein [Acidobacteria bacterium]|nr:BamA/TamA family outer membrane protein [Acidobacteriota bacterium]
MTRLADAVHTWRKVLAGAGIVVLVSLGGADLAAQEQPSRIPQAATPAVATGPAGATAPEAVAPEPAGPGGDNAAASAEGTKKTGFVGLPIPIANPTLQQGLALVGAALYHLGQDAPASMTGVGALYTSTKSWGYGLIQKVYTSHDRWRITAGALRLKLNLRFYGIGANPGPDDPYLPFSLDGKVYGAQVLRSLGKHAYLGAGYIYLSNTTAFDFKNGLPEAPPGDLGLEQSVAVLSLPFLWDTRDNLLNPKQGNYLNVTAILSDPGIGSDVTFQQYRFGYNHYARLNDRMVLAVRGTACDTRDRAPFYLLCTLGAGDGLRGFPTEVYWSGSTAAGVAEWRWSFAGRWGMVAFAGAGATGRKITDLKLDDVVPSYGAGIRFMMAKDYGVNIGIDYGRSHGRDAIYFRVGEAF